MDKRSENNINFHRIKKSIEYIIENVNEQPSIDDLAKQVHLSKFHFQRLFKEWAGVTPKKFLQYITLNELKKKIQKEKSIQELSEKSGLSSQSRVYDLFVNIEAVTPYEYKNKGLNISIQYGIHNTPFGLCFIANTKRGVCGLEFINMESEKEKVVIEFKEKWKNAHIEKNQENTLPLIKTIFYKRNGSIKALLFGSEFQIKVWEALVKIPFGEITTYKEISKSIHKPNTSRAVGSAIGKNNIGYLIPCHRVIQSTGGIGGFKWGNSRKLAIVGWENSKLSS